MSADADLVTASTPVHDVRVTILRHLLPSVLAAFVGALSLTSAGCDVTVSPDPSAVEFRGLVGKPFGPCKGGPGGECDVGFCRGPADGKFSICIPACGLAGCPSIPADMCGGAAPACRDDGLCVFDCVDDADCIAGQGCNDDNFCAWYE